MTPEQSLNLLDQVSSLAPLTRADHIKVQEAVKVLGEAIKKEEIKEEPKENI